jgi:hypothetical protein
MKEKPGLESNRFKGIQYRNVWNFNLDSDKFIYLFDKDNPALSNSLPDISSFGVNIRRISNEFFKWSEQMLKYPFFCIYDGSDIIGVILYCKEDLVMIKLVWGSI